MREKTSEHPVIAPTTTYNRKNKLTKITSQIIKIAASPSEVSCGASYAYKEQQEKDGVCLFYISAVNSRPVWRKVDSIVISFGSFSTCFNVDQTNRIITVGVNKYKVQCVVAVLPYSVLKRVCRARSLKIAVGETSFVVFNAQMKPLKKLASTLKTILEGSS